MRLDFLRTRVRRLNEHLNPSELESWPPEVGSLSRVFYDQLQKEGVMLPESHPSGPVLLFLAKQAALTAFDNEIVGDVR